MQQFRDYAGPSEDDFENILALNTLFLQTHCDLKGPQRGRLAATPFLLFSLREQDLAWWHSALAEQQQRDLTAAAHRIAPVIQQIQTAALSFLWQLAHRNPYVARIVSGASIAWCEQIRTYPLVTVLNRVAGCEDLLVSRIDCGSATGDRLLGNGVSADATVRRSSQLVALHTLITRTEGKDDAQLPAAACSLSVPTRVRAKNV